MTSLVLVQGDAFGCPYVTLASAELAEQLQALRLPAETVRDAVTKAKGKHYQLACMAVFEGQHTCICDSGINHPNQVCCLHCLHPSLLHCRSQRDLLIVSN